MFSLLGKGGVLLNNKLKVSARAPNSDGRGGRNPAAAETASAGTVSQPSNRLPPYASGAVKRAVRLIENEVKARPVAAFGALLTAAIAVFGVVFTRRRNKRASI